jgi:hypothetical protein
MSPSLYLVDHLDRDDFAESVASITGDLGKRIGLPARADEVGLVCPNVEAAARGLKARWPDMKTFLLGEGSPQTFVENGRDAAFTTRVGFGFYKGVILELAEPGVGSDIFSQSPNPEGRIVINHIGFTARDASLTRTDAGREIRWADVMHDAGVPKRVEAVLKLLGLCGHIHIYETRALTHGVEVEFLDFRLFAPAGPRIGYPAFLAGAIGWTQRHLGPRFIDLRAKEPLEPAPAMPDTQLL